MKHEDIRYKVISKLRKIICQAINDIKTSIRDLNSTILQQLNEYEEIILRERDIPLIIKNEKIIEGIGKPDIEIFGGRILIEIKVRTSEFQKGLEQLREYVEYYPYCKYAILTNYDEWKIYRVKNNKLEGPLYSTNSIEETTRYLLICIREVLREGVKLPLSTEHIRNVFKPILLFEEEFYKIFKELKVKEGAFFEAYRNIIKRLYEKASEEEIEKLFIKHTLMQMIVSSCLTASLKRETEPIRACSGAEIEVEIVLPYLNWWESLSLEKTNSSIKKFLTSLTESIYSKALLFDWESGSKEDVFRELYEILIDAETRRKIGEYYTPLWLVEYMIEKLSEDVNGLRGKLVLDPFCGSGTFLVVAFHQKVEEGENPDEAIKEVVGFDINPLATSIARAELMIAYQNEKKSNKGVATPLIFNTDAASILLFASEKKRKTLSEEEYVSFLDELKELERKIRYIDSRLYSSTSDEVDLSEVLKIEAILREYFREISHTNSVEQKLKDKLNELKTHEWKGILTKYIVNKLTDERSIKAIAKLIEKYGDGIWAISISSLFAPYIIRNMKVDIIVTNPPWGQLTEPKGHYGDLLREVAKELLENYEKINQIINGADISSILLHGCINIAKQEIAFLMPEDVSYSAGSFYGLGKILTHSVIKGYDGEIIQINYDAFQHGRLPCIILLRKKWEGKRAGEIRCFSMRGLKWKNAYSKALHLSDVEYNIEKQEDYRDYLKKVMIYTEYSPESLKESLDVEEVVSTGTFIRGLLGGVKKKGAKKYAGLVFKDISEDTTTEQYTIRLVGTNTMVKLPKYFLLDYWKKLIYVGEVYPFYLNQIYDVLLSSKGEEDLKEFLQKRILEKVSGKDMIMVKELINELKQSSKLNPLMGDKYYVIYRRSRTFASFVLSPTDLERISGEKKREVIIYDDCSYISTNDEYKAYYYSALLNYLAYKVIEKGGAFERHQYLRPLIAIVRAGLCWKDEAWQREVAELSKEIHKRASACLSQRLGKNAHVEKGFEILKNCNETRCLFEKLNKIIDNNVNDKKLIESLELVCRFGKS